MLPPPIQRPRIPIWTAGYWPATAPFRRAARWDGVAPLRSGHLFRGLSPDELANCVAYIRSVRTSDRRFDVVSFQTEPNQDELVPEYGRAGATWWLESANPVSESLAEFRARVLRGPPK